jgi:hypothetical protein
MAASALFEALPKETRKELKDLPTIITRLEADAQLQRARVEELNAVLGGLGEDSVAAGSASLRGQAGAVVADQQAKLRTDIAPQRTSHTPTSSPSTRSETAGASCGTPWRGSRARR